MPEQTAPLTNLFPAITKLQNDIRAKYAIENKTAKKGQILFVGSSLMEIFPNDKMQKNIGLDKIIYNRGVRATTTSDLLNHMGTIIFDLAPKQNFYQHRLKRYRFWRSRDVFLANYDELHQIKEKLPATEVYVMAYYPINTVDDFGEKRKGMTRFMRTVQMNYLKRQTPKSKSWRKRTVTNSLTSMPG